MGNKQIDQLNAATVVNDTDELVVSQGNTSGLTKKAQLSTVFKTWLLGFLYPQATPTTTGTALSFVKDQVYGSIATPENGNITANITGAKLGVTVTVLHNNGSAPTFDAKFHALSGSGSYVNGVLNFIDCQFIDPTLIRYSISQ